MKCPRCGAEINPNSKFCEACGSQISYQMQREQEMLNIKGCPRCNSSNVQFKREKQGERSSKKSKQVIHRTVGMCKDCGYTWYADTDSEIRKKNNTIWWVLGWILCFPIPVMVLIWRRKNKWSVPIKLAVTVAFLLLMVIATGINSNDSKNTEIQTVSEPTPALQSTNLTEKSNSTEKLVSTPTKTVSATEAPTMTRTPLPTRTRFVTKTPTLPPTPNLTGPIEDFVKAFNSSSSTPLLFVESFTPSDKSNKHYRVEFRLNAYKDAIGQSYTWNGQTVDIISREEWLWRENKLRIYMTGSSLENCIEMVRIASPIMDGTISNSELQKTLDYLEEHKEANGYYYSNLGLVLSRNNLMIKMRND